MRLLYAALRPMLREFAQVAESFKRPNKPLGWLNRCNGDFCPTVPRPLNQPIF